MVLRGAHEHPGAVAVEDEKGAVVNLSRLSLEVRAPPGTKSWLKCASATPDEGSSSKAGRHCATGWSNAKASRGCEHEPRARAGCAPCWRRGGQCFCARGAPWQRARQVAAGAQPGAHRSSGGCVRRASVGHTR